ncbi:hypothetical protein [Pseudooceanicola onchidii]|uniref:hypothetical protein n=1 Tax=Pseudooceanicola onchidii TaxID=2562279 RepID=UPI0010A9A55E|nr:hypothetical protein [Pseudooceanicola onchidii]
MHRHLLVTGQSQAGSSLLYSMLQRALRDFNIPGPEFPARAVIHMPGNTCSRRGHDLFDFDRIVAAAEGRKRLDAIVMLRDPRDILTSYDARLPDDYVCAADRSYFVNAQGGPQQILPGVLEIHAQIAALAASDSLPQGVILLKYEHLVDEPRRVQNLLADCLELTFDGDFSQYHPREIATHGPELTGVRPADAPREARWRLAYHRDRIIDQFTRFPALHQIVEDLGYEEDRSWFDRFVAEEGVAAVSA